MEALRDWSPSNTTVAVEITHLASSCRHSQRLYTRKSDILHDVLDVMGAKFFPVYTNLDKILLKVFRTECDCRHILLESDSNSEVLLSQATALRFCKALFLLVR